MIRTIFLVTGIVGLMAPGASMAIESMATTDLNMRAGPGPNYAVVDVIPGQAAVDVSGCIAAVNWCQVSYDGRIGWSYGAYLTTRIGDELLVVSDNRDRLGVGTVIYDEPVGSPDAILSSPDAIVGELIPAAPDVPVGIITDPGENVRRYVISNPVEPLYLEGEVVPGARIPDAIDLREVPESTYSYAYVNGMPVVVEPSDRRIVYVLRQ